MYLMPLKEQDKKAPATSAVLSYQSKRQTFVSQLRKSW